MSYKSGFYKGRLGIGLANSGGDGTGNPRFPLDVNGDIRLTGSLLRSDGTPYLGGGLINYIPKGIKSILNNDGSYYVGFGSHTPTEALDISGNLKVSGQILSVDGDNFSTVVPITQQQTTTENPTWHGNVTTTVSNSTDSASELALKANIATPTFTSNLKIEQTGTNNNTLIINTNNHNNGIDIEAFQSDSTSTKKKLCLNPYGGNVGIGTTSPGYKLEVNGSAKLGETTVSYLKNHLSSGTGIWFDYANTMRFITNDNEKMIIKPDGNVGIGTTSPGARLGIEPEGVGTRIAPNNASHKALSIDDGNNGLYVNLGTSGDGTTAAFGLNWYNSNTHTDVDNALVLSNVNGENRVGIGTTSPYSKLHINKGTGETIWNTNFKPADCHLYMGGNEWGPVGATLKFGFGYIDRSDGNIPCYMGARVESTVTDGEYAIVFGTRNSTADTVVPEERMCITHDGNVGIGTPSPDNLLHLKGSYPIQIEHETNSTLKLFINYNQIHTEGNNNLYLNYNSQKDVIICGQGGNVGIGTTQPDKYYLNSSGTGGTFTGFDTILAINGGAPGQTNGSPCVLFQCDDYHTASIYAEHTGNGNTYMGFSTTTGTAAPVERMRIDKDGNVGIGTTDPYSTLSISKTSAPSSIDTVSDFYLGIGGTEHGNSTRRLIGFGYVDNSTHSYPTYIGFLTSSNSGETQGHLVFGTRNSTTGSTVPSERMRICDTGEVQFSNVGIPDQTNCFSINSKYSNNNYYGWFFRHDTLNTFKNNTTACTMYLNYHGGGDLNICGGANGGTLNHYGIHNASDNRIKHNEIKIENALTTINKLNGMYYIKTPGPYLYDENHNFILNDDGKPIDISGVYKHEFGFIAQEVEKIPELAFLVNNNEKDGKELAKSLNYEGLFVMNVVATQELDKQQQADKAEIAELKTKVANLESELAAIKSHLGI